ncbi:DEAD/DEAH box helicase [Halobellus limi]|uniref:ATP-dependent helicase Lhr and Lhr-like helicase n=1 Tax=Halobellus limi TaxID=699433 RepID=A0A1H5ZNW2_9EURY|nr:DEAD/DEAH box helicase [Halobellus limi]QCC48002.1 DEAD/DEAH box helicase [Halobellus limi]SEG38208.1 ATP-dependent helicase Lhr and Lhr-like helicase [Halobellus limi]
MSEGASQRMDAFTSLGEPVRAALSDRGFETPTEPQRRAIPPLAAGKNALVIAPTGTGKTETAMLPVLDAIVRSGPDEREGLSALYITPLRALNRDMRQRLEWWGETLNVEIDVRHGDTTQYQRGKQADDPPDVLVTTPETLQAMLTGKKLRRALSDVRHVVVDEVHELASAKRGAQLTVALERLRALAGPFQRIGLSATVGSPEEVGKFLTGDRDFEIVEVDVGSDVSFTVTHPEITPEDEKLAGKLATDDEIGSHVRAIRDVVRDHESTLVFVNTRQTAEALGSRFKTLGEPIEVHHGSLSKDVRIDVEDRFKSGDLDALVCTSSMELGIDVGRVDHVVQYGSPREVSRLLQRVGRAGHRRDEVSRGTLVTSSPDDTLEALAIARRAEDGEVEPARIHHASLDTVANQIVGVVMDEGEVSARRAYDLVTAAYPFSDLDTETFREVVRELSKNRLLWLDEEADRLEKSGGTWQYFYANLSMIPDEETYDVHDISSRGQIGTLDERFVVNFAEPGAAFVQRGEMWRINDIDDEEARVNVTPIEDPSGEVPSWTGSEIPVPAAVANEVGEIRDVAAGQFESGASRAAVARDLRARYPTDAATLEAALEPIERQVEAGHPVPTAERLVVEGQARQVVLNSPYGHRVNETLGRLLAALVGQRTGTSVGMEISPYRIELEVSSRASARDVVEVLETTDPDHVEAVLELALKNSDALKFTLAQVAAKFGALKRYQGRERFGADRLLAALEDTPVYDEAVREVFHVDLAVEETADLLDRLRDEKERLTLATARERTPIGVDGRSSGRELLVPENADASVIEAIEERIRNDRVRLLCLHCSEWEHTTKVRRVRDQPECPECGATRIACLNPWDEETPAAVRADPDERDDEEERLVERAYRSASLVQSHGKQAVIALAGRGVGPQTAARIIGKLREDEADFYRDILEQERQYARTQSFWD